MVIPVLAILSIVIALASTATAQTTNHSIQYINLLDYNVVGANYSQWHTNNTFLGFNPTNTTPPFIQVFDASFLNVTGPNATIQLVASHPGFAVAHEAPIFEPDLNVVFFCSNAGGPLGYSGWYNNSVVSMINMTQVETALSSNTSNVTIQTVTLPDTVQMVNGGTGLYKGNLLFVTSGRALFPPSVVLVNPYPPYNATVLLDNFFGRQFNSLNDVKVLPGTGVIYFTDDSYGYLKSVFRPEPHLPEQVYRFDPSTGQVQVVADQFVEPNGIAFTPDGKTAFVTDTGLARGTVLGINQTFPATIYQYDVDPVTQSFGNRRVFAFSDSFVPDGVQLDTQGNVYSGCGDGVHVWNPQGKLIGKFYFNSTTAEMVFTNDGLVVLNEENVYFVNISARGIDLSAH